MWNFVPAIKCKSSSREFFPDLVVAFVSFVNFRQDNDRPTAIVVQRPPGAWTDDENIHSWVSSSFYSFYHHVKPPCFNEEFGPCDNSDSNMTFPSPTCPHLHNPGPLKIVHTFQAELIFVTNITNYICGEKIVMWRNFGKFWEILEILPQFTRFHVEKN